MPNMPSLLVELVEVEGEGVMASAPWLDEPVVRRTGDEALQAALAARFTRRRNDRAAE